MKSLAMNLLRDESGQDLIEYALMASFGAVSAGAIFPPAIMQATNGIFSKVVSTLTRAGS